MENIFSSKKDNSNTSNNSAMIVYEDFNSRDILSNVAGFSVNTGRLTTEEIEVISRHVGDQYFPSQKDIIQNFINTVINYKKRGWTLIGIRIGGRVEVCTPLVNFTLIYETETKKEVEICSPAPYLDPLPAPSPVLLHMPSVYTDFTGFRTSDIISSVVIKLGDEPDPDPYILKTWKEMWGNSENEPPIYISSEAQFAIEDSMYAKKHITKVGDFSVNTDGLTSEEVELISHYVGDNYFKLQEDVQTLINKVIDEKKSGWNLIKIEDGGCVETDPPAEYINLTYETGTKKIKLEILYPSDHSTEQFIKESDDDGW